MHWTDRQTVIAFHSQLANSKQCSGMNHLRIFTDWGKHKSWNEATRSKMGATFQEELKKCNFLLRKTYHYHLWSRFTVCFPFCLYVRLVQTMQEYFSLPRILCVLLVILHLTKQRYINFVNIETFSLNEFENRKLGAHERMILRWATSCPAVTLEHNKKNSIIYLIYS